MSRTRAKAKRHMLEMLHDPKVRRRISSMFDHQPSPASISPTNGGITFTIRPASSFQKSLFKSEYVRSKRHPKYPVLATSGVRRGRGAMHRMDIPGQRVFRVIKAIEQNGLRGVPVAKKRKRRNQLPPPINQYEANPLLLTVNPKKRKKAKSNPGAQVSIPFKKGQSINRQKFEKWLYENCPDAWVKGYEKSMAQYKKFHMGTLPKNITMEVVPVGGDIVLPPEFMYSAGKSPAETYTPDGRSGKAPSSYVHEYTDQPQMLVGGSMGDQFIIKPLRGRARIDDWMRD